LRMADCASAFFKRVSQIRPPGGDFRHQHGNPNVDSQHMLAYQPVSGLKASPELHQNISAIR